MHIQGLLNSFLYLDDYILISTFTMFYIPEKPKKRQKSTKYVKRFLEYQFCTLNMNEHLTILIMSHHDYAKSSEVRNQFSQKSSQIISYEKD